MPTNDSLELINNFDKPFYDARSLFTDGLGLSYYKNDFYLQDVGGITDEVELTAYVKDEDTTGVLYSLFPNSIAEENIKRIQVYPNPGKNYIVVDSDSKQEKEIYDLQAKKLISTKNQKIDISSLSREIHT